MSRRANGEGSVYRRSDGRWVAAHYVLRPDGGRERRQIYGKTRAEVSARLAEMVARTHAGVPLATKAWTVQDYAEHWLTDIVAPRLRPATLASYRSTVRVALSIDLGITRAKWSVRATWSVSVLRASLPGLGSCRGLYAALTHLPM